MCNIVISIRSVYDKYVYDKYVYDNYRYVYKMK